MSWPTIPLFLSLRKSLSQLVRLLVFSFLVNNIHIKYKVFFFKNYVIFFSSHLGADQKSAGAELLSLEFSQHVFNLKRLSLSQCANKLLQANASLIFISLDTLFFSSCFEYIFIPNNNNNNNDKNIFAVRAEN